MPNKCCVLGCNSSYSKTQNRKIHVFSFPRDVTLKAAWLTAVGRKHFKPGKYSVICDKHFHESDIIRHCTGIDSKTGEQFSFPMSKVKLKEGVIPSIDLNNPYNQQKVKETETEKLVTPTIEKS